MNRTIKFRAWDKDRQVMYNWEDLQQMVHNCLDFWSDLFTDNSLIVMQFINSQDKNDVEIYDGDLVKYMDGRIMEVFYSSNGYVGWKLRRKPNHGGKGLLIYGLYNHKGGSGAEEVIGNIHSKSERKENADCKKV